MRPSPPRSVLQASTVALLSCAIAIVVAAGCERSGTQEAAGHKPPRIVVLGLDAGTWDLLGPWMDQGLLPNLARLRDSGVHGKLRSTEPSSSPVVWTSIATGKTPEKTGIDWFVRFPDGPGKPVPVDRTMRRTQALWNILSGRRIDVAVIGWYVTWPAEEVYGRLLSDHAHYGDLQARAWPSTFLWDLKPVPPEDAVEAMPRFMDFEYDPAKAVRGGQGQDEVKDEDKQNEDDPPSLDFLVYDRFVRAWSRDRFYLDAARRALADGPLPEVFFLYLRGTDDVQHGFWKFMDPEVFRPRTNAAGKAVPGTVDVPAEQVAAFGKVIQRYWQWTDQEVGRILAAYGDDPPLVLACSDHGAGPAVGEFQVEVEEYMHLSGSHRIDGFFLASGPGIRQGGKVEGATIYDIAPTILHALGLPIPRDMDGQVLAGLFTDQRPDTFVDTYDKPGDSQDENAEVSPEVDTKILEHLRSLGYIGDP